LNTSLKQIIEKIKTVAETSFSDEIQYVEFEQFKFTSKSKVFPQLSYYLPDGALTLGQNVNQVSLHLMFADQVTSQNNEDEYIKEVISDMYDLSSRFVTHLQKVEKWQIVYPINPTQFVKKGADGNGGVEFDLVINLARPCLTT